VRVAAGVQSVARAGSVRPAKISPFPSPSACAAVRWGPPCTARGRTLVKRWSDAGQIPVKCESNTGQMRIEYWSNADRIMLECGSSTRLPPPYAPPSSSSSSAGPEPPPPPPPPGRSRRLRAAPAHRAALCRLPSRPRWSNAGQTLVKRWSNACPAVRATATTPPEPPPRHNRKGSSTGQTKSWSNTREGCLGSCADTVARARAHAHAHACARARTRLRARTCARTDEPGLKPYTLVKRW
jgi:hypothetical protein